MKLVVGEAPAYGRVRVQGNVVAQAYNPIEIICSEVRRFLKATDPAVFELASSMQIMVEIGKFKADEASED